jgi:hypothetical protein
VDLILDIDSQAARRTARKGEPAGSFAWLGGALPPHCRIVVSNAVVSAAELAPVLKECACLPLEDLPQEAAAAALDYWLGVSRRRLQPAQRELLLAAFSRCPRPLYLKLAFEEARGWASYLPEKAWFLGEGVEGVIDTLIHRQSRNNAEPARCVCLTRWKTARRVVAKVEFHFGELFPRVRFIVTNLETDSRAVVRFYNKRGTAEQWIKEGKQAVKMTRLSCHRFRSNEVRLWLSVMAYNLGNLWRRLVLPRKIENWSLTSLQQRLVKTGGRLVKHARYYWLLLAESHLTRRLFGSMVRRIDALAVATG